MAAATAQLKGVIRLQQGCRVQVHGLQKQSELNGLIGRCLQFDAAKLRWGVELPGGKQIALKMGNIMPLPDAEVTEATETGPNNVPKPTDDTTVTVDGVTIEEVTEDEPPAAAPAAEEAAVVEAPAPAPAAVEEPVKEPVKEEAPAETAAVLEAAPEAPAEPAKEAATEAAPGAPLEEGKEETTAEPVPTTLGEDEELPTAKCPPAPKTGRWFEHEAASENFAEQLLQNDPALTSLCLVPPKRFEEEDCEKISAGLEANSHCKELFASGHSLSESSCQRLAQMLRKNSSLELLSVGDSSLGDLASVMFAGLAENTSLTHLDLELKGLTIAAGSSLAEALVSRGQKGAKPLDVLKLSRNRDLGDSLVPLSKSPAPRELSLYDFGLGEKHAADVGRWVKAGIEDLDLRDNSRLGADGLELMLNPMLGCRDLRLTKLRLDGCAIGDDGLEALAEAIKKGLPLEELFLERCELTSAGCEHLERACLGHRLRMLCVRTNTVGDEGCELLSLCTEKLDIGANNVGATSMPHLGQQPLRSLELFNNPLLGQSVTAWCPALRSEHWQCLEHLDMSACLLGDDGFRLVCTALKERPALMPKLTSLCLGGNDAQDSDEFNDLVESLTDARDGKLRVIWKNT